MDDYDKKIFAVIAIYLAAMGGVVLIANLALTKSNERQKRNTMFDQCIAKASTKEDVKWCYEAFE